MGCLISSRAQAAARRWETGDPATGQVFELAKEFVELPPGEIEALLESPIHEVRAGALSIMDKQARSKMTPEGRRMELYELDLIIS